MALAKLWTALFGKREEVKPEVGPANSAANAPTSVQPPTISPVSGVAKPKPPTASTHQVSAPLPAAVGSQPSAKSQGERTEQKTRTGQRSSTAKGRSKDASPTTSAPVIPALAPLPAVVAKPMPRRQTAWTKRLNQTTVTCVLDLCLGNANATVSGHATAAGVGEMSHVAELLDAVVDGTTPGPKYVAISQFELAGQGLTLQQFHKQIRLLGGSPIAIPMSLAEGLKRLSETIGTVDLILLDQDSRLTDPAYAKLFKRVMRPTTRVFARDNKGQWLPVVTTTPSTASNPPAVTGLKVASARSAPVERTRKAA